MADFNTHFFVASAVGVVYATVATKALLLPTQPALLLAGMTAVGGILPDIDLKDSTPSKALFLVLGAIVATLWILQQVVHFSVVELLAIGALLFAGVRYPLWWLFHQFTVHRVRQLCCGFVLSRLGFIRSRELAGRASGKLWLPDPSLS